MNTARADITLADSYSYDAYGVMLSDAGSGADAAAAAGTSLLYAGEQYDSDLDQYYLRARYYNPTTGLFNRLDPYEGNTADPQSLHKYLYCHGNPVNNIDPTGFSNFSIISLVSFIAITTLLTTNYANAPIVGAQSYAEDTTGDLVVDCFVCLAFCAAIIVASYTLKEVIKIIKPKRLPQDINVNPSPPPAKRLDRPISKSKTQNMKLQSDIDKLKHQGYTDFRVDQHQINASGKRVGVNRPDLQATSPNGQRVYFEYETFSSPRGPAHESRILANDADGVVIICTVQCHFRSLTLNGANNLCRL